MLYFLRERTVFKKFGNMTSVMPLLIHHEHSFHSKKPMKEPIAVESIITIVRGFDSDGGGFIWHDIYADEDILMAIH